MNLISLNYMQNKNFYWRLFFFMMIILLINANDCAWADDNNQETVISGVLCKIVKLMTGDIAKAIALLAIIGLAIGLILGKLNWMLFLLVLIAIAMIFGAKTVIQWLSNQNMGSYCTLSS